jgi:hypothetical protein
MSLFQNRRTTVRFYNDCTLIAHDVYMLGRDLVSHPGGDP